MPTAILGFQVDPNIKNLKSLQQRFRGALTPRKLGLAGLALAGGIGAAALRTTATAAQYAIQLDNVAQRTGLNVSLLSQLEVVLKRTGGSVDDLEDGIKTLNERIVDAQDGMADAGDSLALLGLNADTLAKLRPEQQLAALADGLARVENIERRAAIASILLGDSGVRLIPVLGGGAERVREMTTEVNALGQSINPELVRNARETAKIMGDLNIALDALGRDVATVLLPIINAISGEKGIRRQLANPSDEDRPFVPLLRSLGILGPGPPPPRRANPDTYFGAGLDLYPDRGFRRILAQEGRIRDVTATVNIYGGNNTPQAIETNIEGVLRRAVGDGGAYNIQAAPC